MNCDDLVSVIIPAYNCEKTINKCVFSVLKQTYTNLQILIINDGSSDNTKQICNLLENEDNRIKLYNINNSGPSFARNYGLKVSNGKYIIFVDSDDEIENNHVRVFCESIFGNELVIAGYKIKSSTNTSLIHCKNEIISKYDLINNFSKHYESQLFRQIWNKIYFRSVIENHNISFDTNIRNGEDFLFNLMYLKYIDNIRIIDSTSYIYYVSNTNSLTGNYIINYYGTRKYILEQSNLICESNVSIIEYLKTKIIRDIDKILLNLFHKNSPYSAKEIKHEIALIVNDLINDFEVDRVDCRFIKYLIKYRNINGIYAIYKIRSKLIKVKIILKKIINRR